jgi:orotate phosphoribosyltransferase
MKFSSSYLTLAHPDLRATVDRIVPVLIKLHRKLKFDAIAVRGVSGHSIGFPVSYITAIPLLVIRKEQSSHGCMVQGSSCVDVKKYLILDDFIETGRTIDEMLRTVIDYVYNRTGSMDQVPKCVGIALYGNYFGGINDRKHQIASGMTLNKYYI